jgi:type I restriction enzyme S subunit
VSSSYSEAGLAQSRLWPVNTLCITIAANIGKTAILGIDACFPDSVVGFLPTSDNVSVRYVEYSMRTAQQKLEAEAPATAQKNINLKILDRVCLPLPPLNEQLQIVNTVTDTLNEVCAQDQAIEQSLKQSGIQRKNILQAAFSGQLVPQDPNDEPVSKLLERIRTEREERGKQPKPRKMKIKKEISAMVTKLKDVLAEAGDWIPAQEAFRRCGVADSAHTDQVEALYAELRELDKSNQLAVESVKDAQGRKLYDQLKFIVTN